MNNFLTFLIFLFVLSSVYGDELSYALNVKPVNSIKCSDHNKQNFLSPSQALTELSRGDELLLASENYGRQIVITTDKTIITGDKKGRCNANIRVLGKGCIIRDIWVRSLIVEKSVIIVNSIVENLYSKNVKKGKLNHIIYNTALGHVENLNRDAKITCRNCIGRNSNSIFKINNRSKLILQDSIFQSNNYVFELVNRGTIKGKISLDNTYLYGSSGIGVDISARVRSRSTAYTLKELKKVSNLTLHGNNKVKKLVFKSGIDVDVEHAIFKVGTFLLSNKELQNSKLGIDTKLNPFFTDEFLQSLNYNWNDNFKNIKNQINEKLTD